MKTLVFVMVLAAGCKDKPAEQSPPPAPAPAPAPRPAPAPSDAGADAPPQPAIPNEPTVVVSGVPKECSDYEAAIERLKMCTKLDVASRAKLRHTYNVAATAWQTMSDAEKKKLTKTCRDGVAEIDAVAKKPCGW